MAGNNYAPESAVPVADLAEVSGEFCEGMEAFFALAEREIREHNNSDFDNIEFLLKGARAEVFRFIGRVAKVLEGGAA